MNHAKDGPKNAPVGKRLIAGVIDLAISITLIGIPYLGLFWVPLYAICRDGLRIEGLQYVSVGKSIMGLKVVSYASGDDLNRMNTSLKRNIILLLPVMLPVELFFILTDRDRRRLGDRIAGTWVVENAQNPWLELVRGLSAFTTAKLHRN